MSMSRYVDFSSGRVIVIGEKADFIAKLVTWQ